jgi:hypothetical protein
LIRGSRASLGRCCRAAIAKLESKFLNQRTESREAGAVTNLDTIAKIFHKIFTFDLAGMVFQTAWPRYVDK